MNRCRAQDAGGNNARGYTYANFKKKEKKKKKSGKKSLRDGPLIRRIRTKIMVIL